MAIRIHANFDAGNIDVLKIDGPTARLAIKKDAGDEHLQWFYFRVSGARDREISLQIENAAKVSYPGGWPDYRAVVSYDREEWFRVPTRYDAGELFIEFTPERDTVFVAYFAPYSMERHYDLIGQAQRAGARVENLGDTLDGQPLDLITIGEGDVPCWIIARQHPGESMAEWFMEGLLERLLDDADPVARALREKTTLYLVPNMNPDGSRRGHLRTNASGANLNREWETPTMERSPEVLLVRDRMDQTGLRFCLDVHGDEALPYNFIAGSDGVEGLSEKTRAALETYKAILMRVNPDFQIEKGYPRSQPGNANMTMCTNQIAHRFSALAMTLEQPFKDNKNAEDARYGWSPARAKLLGRANLDALLQILPEL